MTVDDLAGQYQRFCASHPCTFLVSNSSRWEYILCGQGRQAMLLLPGALGTAETSFEYILAFESSYRVVSVSYPSSIRSVEPLVQGVIDILDAQQIDRAHVIAGSYSGFIAQCLVRQFPTRVQSLVLSDVGVPRPERVPRTKAMLLAASIKPWSAMKAMLRFANRIALPKQTPEHIFWRGYFDAAIESITPDDLTARLAVTMDFDSCCTFTPSDLDHWEGRILVVDSEGDQFFPAAERAAVRNLYPGARVHTFLGGGHSGTLDQAAEHIAVYRDFLEQLHD